MIKPFSMLHGAVPLLTDVTIGKVEQMEDKVRSSRRTIDSGFKERVVAMAAKSDGVAETARQPGDGYSLLNSLRNASELALSKGQGLSMAVKEKPTGCLREGGGPASGAERDPKEATAYFAWDRVPPRSTPGSKA